MSSKDKLVEVALQEFLVNGYQRTSLSLISGKLGITKPALYYYFSSKKELFIECIQVFLTHIEDTSVNYKSESVSTKEKIRDIIVNYSDPSRNLKPEWQNEGFNNYYFVFDAIKNVPEVKDLFMNSSSGALNELELIIIEGIKNNELKHGIDVEVLVSGIGFLIEGFALGRYMGVMNGDSKIIDNMFELIWNGIK